ncbi:MAG: P83/100 family protein [Turneriella sp.]
MSPVAGLSVDEEEIKSKSGITFINRAQRGGGDSVSDIMGIGRRLADSGKYGSYSVIHAVGEGDDQFDADIIVIGANARVDHIKNVRRIIASYLMQKYEYSAEEAKSLAVFVTYYNGFYRKNMAYFKEHYKPEVTKHLKTANAGLDRSYKGWPGKSRIVIPLSGDEKPDAGKIGEKDVMDKVRKEEKDKGVKDRETITRLQEKELKKKEDRVKKQREDLDRRKDDVAKREERLKDDKRKNEDNPDAADKARKDEELKKKEEELNKEKDQLKKEEEKVAKDEKKVEDKKSEVAQNKQNIQDDKTKAERKNETPAQREARLDAKEKELKDNRPQDGIFGGKLYYLRVRDFSTDGKYRNDFYIIDPKNRKVRVKSPYPGIVGKKFDVVDKDVVVIGEKKTATTTQHFLVKLDGETLVDKKYGSDEVFWRGFVEVRENEIYAILNSNGTFYLGKFDKDLNLLQKSDVALHEDTFFSFYEDTIYVNGADRKIEVLNRKDLKSAGNIVP